MAKREPLYLIGMKVSNYLKIENFDYQFDGKSVTIAGPNAAGKTTLFKAIWAACLGKTSIPADAIHNGAEKSEIEIDLGDLIVKRTITKKDAYVTVTTKDGLRATNPQTILDKLVGAIALDPHAFITMDQKKQAETTAACFGIQEDLNKIDAQIKTFAEERTYVNRQCKELLAQLKDVDVKKPDAVKVDVTELVKQKAEIQRAEERAGDTRRKIDLNSRDIDRFIKEIQILEEKLAISKKDLARNQKELKASHEFLEKMPTVNDLDNQIQEVSVKNQEIDRQQHAWERYDEQTDKLDQVEEKSTELSATIDKLRLERQGVIGKAKLPVEGLSFADGILTYNDHPLANASHAEQLRVAIGILMAQDPDLKLLTITDASLMDKSSWKVIEDLAKKHKFQVLYEVVSDEPSEGVLYIQDGKVQVEEPVEEVEEPLEKDAQVEKPAEKVEAGESDPRD